MTENKKTIINILIVFYTRYGNSARMADEISKGAKEIPEAHVAIKRIADDVFVSILRNISIAGCTKSSIHLLYNTRDCGSYSYN